MKNISYKWIALSCTTLGALFSVLNGSMLLISLPDIMKGLHANMGIIMWIVMGYMLSLTILVPAIGRIADMFGRKKLYVSGFAIFTIGSLLCGISNSGLQLLIYRIVQSVGGSLMVANSTAIVADAFPKNELGKALGINSMVVSIASVIGPILGGFLTSLGWRYIFYINVPFGIIGTLWALIQLKELDKIPEGQKFDLKGTLLFTIGLLLFLIALSFGGFVGWYNKSIITLFIISIAMILAFIHIENTTEQPMLDLRLFKTRILAFAFGSTLLNGIARGAVTFLLIFYLQGIKAMDPLKAGVFLAPFALSMMIVSPISGYLSDKYGARALSSIGLLISAIGLLGFVRISQKTSLAELITWMLIMGFGSGMFFSPNTSEIMGSVPSDRRGIAAGTRTMMNNAGQVISIALSMAIVSSSITPDAMQALFVGTQVGSKGIAIAQFISGLREAFLISMIFSLIASFISYLRGPKPDWNQNSHKIKTEET
ncbi:MULTISPECIES: MFS transporter [Thermoanaerobacterium]|uniref:EmrB/QacA subfamily drug resistance transporter n=2 Tax=Thermoanaerobacterium TaxID=28895 RepID=W9EF25_9THEO|nr:MULTISPECIES: MFS transporter [Thermoanaerobacterium]AFK86646.1 drug resistance transporter, EmrB/QacA subfamily [Thermoanaerobacterium saccharolyticum JW/SL-YS485]ETO38339.1 EmrB/QacA subfamily drug resistance transporter [Thermoanaerobacterium aotearoense SCUT27]